MVKVKVGGVTLAPREVRLDQPSEKGEGQQGLEGGATASGDSRGPNSEAKKRRQRLILDDEDDEGDISAPPPSSSLKPVPAPPTRTPISSSTGNQSSRPALAPYDVSMEKSPASRSNLNDFPVDPFGTVSGTTAGSTIGRIGDPTGGATVGATVGVSGGVTAALRKSGRPPKPKTWGDHEGVPGSVSASGEDRYGIGGKAAVISRVHGSGMGPEGKGARGVAPVSQAIGQDLQGVSGTGVSGTGVRSHKRKVLDPGIGTAVEPISQKVVLAHSPGENGEALDERSRKRVGIADRAAGRNGSSAVSTAVRRTDQVQDTAGRLGGTGGRLGNTTSISKTTSGKIGNSLSLPKGLKEEELLEEEEEGADDEVVDEVEEAEMELDEDEDLGDEGLGEEDDEMVENADLIMDEGLEDEEFEDEEGYGQGKRKGGTAPLTMRQQRMQRGSSGLDADAFVEFPEGLIETKSRKTSKEDTEAERLLKREEAARKRKLQVEKAARESQAAAIKKLLGQDSTRKRREEKLRQVQAKTLEEKEANEKSAPSNTIRFVERVSGQTVSWAADCSLPPMFAPGTPGRVAPPPRALCAGPGCANPHRFRDRLSGQPLCSLICYRHLHLQHAAQEKPGNETPSVAPSPCFGRGSGIVVA
eukprot:TRINITY_DN23529_c0_g1_i1.p1 TRINITY_DN23529_c0_g1~~TRINITY_DN23529_c0_g1_i1.p1  ORF type:complete len:720 (+),score=137.03 TRINITY_DN23529_c0_g1_i1:232-2160(+)